MDVDVTYGDIGAMLETERPRLVRLCARLTGSAEPAEDLAQETLLEAWRHFHKLHEPAGYTAWLSAIARNVCRRWAHAQRGEHTFPLMTQGEGSSVERLGDEPADSFDFEVDLERSELVELLDRALSLLPTDTRTVLIKRYVDVSPHAEIAAALGMSEGAVKVKVHRGKLALRRVLTNNLWIEAASFGIVDPDANPIHATDLWCPVCGKHRLEAHISPDGEEAALGCATCCANDRVFIYGSVPTGALRNSTTLATAIEQQTREISKFFRAGVSGQSPPCCICGRTTRFWTRELRAGLTNYRDVCQFSSTCVHCESSSSISWRMLAQSHPDVWQFWQRNPRMFTLPPRAIESEGITAVVTGFRTLSGRAGLDVITARDTLRVLGVHPASGR